MFSTGPWPHTRTCLSRNCRNIRSGLWDRITCSSFNLSSHTHTRLLSNHLIVTCKTHHEHYISMVHSTKVLCPFHFLTKLRFRYWVIAWAFSDLWTKCETLTSYRNEEKWPYWHSSSNVSGCTKVLCPFHSSTKVLSPATDLIPRPMSLLFDM